MEIKDAGLAILSQLERVIAQMTDDDFVKPSPALGDVSIGQHLRHTIEFFFCLETGSARGVVNYDKRGHDVVIETDRSLALTALERIRSFIEKNNSSRPLRLEVGYDRHSEQLSAVDTNYLRELIYNIEHAVHHMALMKIGIREVAPYVIVPADFGIAVSTLRYTEGAHRHA
jgi:hypothetical protein